MRNISNVNSNIILKEKYYENPIAKFENLNELFNDNFLKENERLIHYYQENQRSLLKSSQLKKLNNNPSTGLSTSNFNNNNINFTKYTSGLANDTGNMKKSMSSFYSVDVIEQKRNKINDPNQKHL